MGGSEGEFGTRTSREDEYPVFEGERVRDRLVAALRVELRGPESEHEVLNQSPRTRYLVGQLAPRNTEIDAMEDEGQDAADSEEDGDGNVPLRASLEASSIGISFVLDASVDAVDILATWGEYERTLRVIDEPLDESGGGDDDGRVDSSDEDYQENPPLAAAGPGDTETPVRRKSKEIEEWRRTPRSMGATLDLSNPQEILESDRGVEIRALVRNLGGDRIVSVFLDNVREAPLGKRPQDWDYLYQPKIHVGGTGTRILPRRRLGERPDPDPDVASADLVYRHRKEFAVGHGVAADWGDEIDGFVSEVWTEIMPTTVVPRVTPREDSRLSMDFLGTESRNEVAARLHEFVTDYQHWINECEKEANQLSSPLDSTAKDHVALARQSLARMRAGIEALGDDRVFKAFQFANQAMALQRRRSIRVRNERRGLPTPERMDANWRPFQIGFMLQVLPGLSDPSHSDREIADLLWFPTGGGKTEAYLGLTAFIIALRRLRGDGAFDTSAGTAVIMRYTLRLLTIQQFQRALTLISACEYLRSKDPATWGDERFTIGLWVGKSVTPNSFEEAKASLSKLKSGQDVFNESPYQILFCPWCGNDLSPDDYYVVEEDERIEIKCRNPECEFHTTKAKRGLPALVVDQEIYRNPPSLLLATVDKFAQMTWNGRIQSLFGRVDRYCERHGWISAADEHPDVHRASAWFDEVVVRKVDRNLAPPDLIIQDELHLISGPLGTLVGIYETVVDGLSAYEIDGVPVRPKVVASTATVRRARTQVRALFDRQISVFPPQGLDVADSFFATESADDPGRMYVGVFGPGRSIKTTLVRTYGALLGRSLVEHRRVNDSESDAYMTLVGYFNSLRELGGALRLVEDDVKSRLRTLKRRGFSDDRVIYNAWELTSRKSSSKIAETLEALDRTHLEYETGRYPLDILLSSNMISVGVDVDRLGLMVVSGQPKTTAEYIQATSRVGREHPGLVIQVYNWIRPRDISHYERFLHYHATFYRHVEATSVTPFSERARDRALPAVLVAYSRLGNPAWSRETGAAQFDRTDPHVKRFTDLILERARRVSRHGDRVADELGLQLANLMFQWENLAKDPARLIYSTRGQGRKKSGDDDERLVLLRPMELEEAKGHWVASGSLREVEEELAIVLKDYRDGEEG